MRLSPPPVDAGVAHPPARQADAITANAPIPISAIKEMVQKTEYLSLADTVALQRAGSLQWYDRVQASEDAKEGPRAFAEKRQAVWSGC